MRQQSTPDAGGLVQNISRNYWEFDQIRRAKYNCDHQTGFIHMDSDRLQDRREEQEF